MKDVIQLKRIIRILRGPYEYEGTVWNLCLLEGEGGKYVEEEVYYPCVEEAISDCFNFVEEAG